MKWQKKTCESIVTLVPMFHNYHFKSFNYIKMLLGFSFHNGKCKKINKESNVSSRTNKFVRLFTPWTMRASGKSLVSRHPVSFVVIMTGRLFGTQNKKMNVICYKPFEITLPLIISIHQS